VAAIKINGQTCHKLLSLNVTQCNATTFQELQPAALKQLRKRFRECKLLVIDECR